MRIRCGPSKRVLWNVYVEGIITASHHMLHDCGAPTGQRSEGAHAGLLDAVERLGWRHAKENRTVFRHAFYPDSIINEAEQFERSSR